MGRTLSTSGGSLIWLATLSLCTGLAACAPADQADDDLGATPAPGDGDADAPADGPAGARKPGFRSCTGRPFTAGRRGSFRHIWNRWLSATGAGHAGLDALVLTSERAVVRGKFAYGSLSKDLEDERVRVYLDDCTGWRLLGSALTNGDGRIGLTAPATLPPGVYEVTLEVEGDLTRTQAFLWSVPPGTRLAVTDIDGTLTVDDWQIVFDFLVDLAGGDYVPEAYPGAAELTLAERGRGHLVVYLTGRPYWVQGLTRGWLRAIGATPGPLFTTQSTGDAVPGNAGTGAYKRSLLDGLTARGLVLDVAYGNATSDVFAYLGAGIARERTFIIGPHAGDDGTQPVAGSWWERVADVEDGPLVDQPFTW